MIESLILVRPTGCALPISLSLLLSIQNRSIRPVQNPKRTRHVESPERPANLRPPHCWSPFSQDIQHFFLEYMVNDSLGVICNAHVVEADSNPLGASSEKCRHLAVLA
jgi:hypothetical protein